MNGWRDRGERLLETGLALSSELSLPAILQRIVDLAAEITRARYAALGVLGPDGTITEFITTGVTAAERAAIGPLPVGRGILGVLIDDARTLRLRAIADDPRSVGFPPNHPPMRSFLGAPVAARGTVFGNIYLTGKQGADEFDADDERALEVLAAQAGVAIENARLYEEAHHRAQRLEAIRAITAAILAGTELDAALDLVARHARELVGADLTVIATPAEGGTLALEAADGEHAAELRGTAFPVQGSVSGEVIRTGKVVVLADASADERVWQPIVRTGEIGPALFVPLAAAGRPFGTLMVANVVGGARFGEADVGLTETFAEQASVVLEHARLRRELERLAVLEDRERIAKELHDGAIQSLFAVGLGLQGTASLAGAADIRGRIEAAVEELDHVIRDLRSYIFGLRPGILADRQLDQALRQLVEEFQERTGIVAVAEIDPAVAAELAHRAADLVQLTREALSNVSRHADAPTCRVSLYADGGGNGVLEIEDDGHGFDPDNPAHVGHGMRNLRDRAQALGGHAEISSVIS
ncbi:MAG TPA: GAF domain-containing protein, partial [Actinomycetota bacterium]|nr:GAF domain-containing protein [Actinomycetota bacterium]